MPAILDLTIWRNFAGFLCHGLVIVCVGHVLVMCIGYVLVMCLGHEMCVHD